MDLTILFEDNHILVCLKPAGVLSQGSDKDITNMVDELKEYIKKKYDKPGNVYLGLVHRLDLNVGGVMVFAKTSKAANRLSEQIRNLEFKKTYLAITHGSFSDKQGILKDYMKKDEDQRQAFITSQKDGKIAEMRYQVLDEAIDDFGEYSLLKVNLITGRFHQIRAQLAHHGHPLMGDTKYGKKLDNPDFFIGLYAYEIAFQHPTTKEQMEFIHLPEDGRFQIFPKINEIDWSKV